MIAPTSVRVPFGHLGRRWQIGAGSGPAMWLLDKALRIVAGPNTSVRAAPALDDSGRRAVADTEDGRDRRQPDTPASRDQPGRGGCNDWQSPWGCGGF